MWILKCFSFVPTRFWIMHTIHPSLFFPRFKRRCWKNSSSFFMRTFLLMCSEILFLSSLITKRSYLGFEHLSLSIIDLLLLWTMPDGSASLSWHFWNKYSLYHIHELILSTWLAFIDGQWPNRWNWCMKSWLRKRLATRVRTACTLHDTFWTELCLAYMAALC